jgi:hypothetical protein
MQSLGSLRKVQLKVERSYDRKFLRASTGLDTEQLLFNTPILITPRTWCKSKTNKLLQNLGSITPMHERYSSFRKHTLAKSSLESIQGLVLGQILLFRFLTCMQDVLFDLTWESSQKSKLVPVARLLFVSPYNI